MSFTIAIIGRPNVGKSTLFNRLVGKRLALVDDTPGVTRDRREGEGSLGDLNFKIIDTAGLEEAEKGSLSARMREQTDAGLASADMAIMMLDARAGVTPLDKHFADWIRKRGGCPVILVANKAEGTAGNQGAYEAYGLGLGEPIAISSEHGEGLAELYGAVLEAAEKLGIDTLPDKTKRAEKITGPGADLTEGDLGYEFEDKDTEIEKPMRIAIVGRPNAGKSTLVNQLIGEDRMVTGPEAGITRDSISVEWEYEGRSIKFFDTAGLRKKSRVQGKLEKLSVADALRAVKFAEVVVLLVDAELGLEKQDLKIASLVVQEGRGLVIALNKWDLINNSLESLKALKDTLTRSLPQLKGVKTVNFSAKTGQRTSTLMPAILETHALWNSRIPTSHFNQWLSGVIDQHPPPMVKGRRLKIRFGAQVKTRPPTFVLFVNRPADLPDSYVRYLENELRRGFKLPATPIRFLTRKGANPYESRRRKIR